MVYMARRNCIHLNIVSKVYTLYIPPFLLLVILLAYTSHIFSPDFQSFFLIYQKPVIFSWYFSLPFYMFCVCTVSNPCMWRNPRHFPWLTETSNTNIFESIRHFLRHDGFTSILMSMMDSQMKSPAVFERYLNAVHGFLQP